MLSTDSIARVILNTGSAAPSASAFDTGLILAPSAGFVSAMRLRTYTTSAGAAAGILADGYSASSEPYRAALKYFAASPAPAKLLFSSYPASGSGAETLSQALEAVLEKTSAFYGVFPAGLTGTAAEIQSALLDLEARVRSLSVPLMLFLPVTGTPEAAAEEGSLLQLLSARASRRTLATLVDSAPDAAAVMGTAMGLQRTHPSSAFSLCYQTIPAIQPRALTEAQAEAVKALHGNVYLTRGYTHLLLEPGSTSAGARYDEVMYLDQIGEALRTAALSLLTENGERLPQTDDTTALFINRFSAVLTEFADRGVLATARWRGNDAGPLTAGDMLENGFTLWADSYDSQSDADRAAHQAMPIQAALTLAGSVESIVITVQVSP